MRTTLDCPGGGFLKSLSPLAGTTLRTNLSACHVKKNVKCKFMLVLVLETLKTH